jgi:hypothetical protein
MLSVTSCRTTRLRPAPSASRTQISRSRLMPRASSNPPALTQAMNSTNPTAADRITSGVFAPAIN